MVILKNKNEIWKCKINLNEGLRIKWGYGQVKYDKWFMFGGLELKENQ